jgi:hypothetical protein
MFRWDPVVSDRDLENWRGNPLRSNDGPRTMVGWGTEPLAAMKDIIFPGVEEIVIG